MPAGTHHIIRSAIKAHHAHGLSTRKIVSRLGDIGIKVSRTTVSRVIHGDERGSNKPPSTKNSDEESEDDTPPPPRLSPIPHLPPRPPVQRPLSPQERQRPLSPQERQRRKSCVRDRTLINKVKELLEEPDPLTFRQIGARLGVSSSTISRVVSEDLGIVHTPKVSHGPRRKNGQKKRTPAPRIMTEEDCMQAAITEAERGLSDGGIPIGCVLVHKGKIVGRGHNQRVQKNSVVLHAEMDALENAGRQSVSFYKECVLYTTLSPCAMCSGSILFYKIPHVVIGENTTFIGEEELLKSRGVKVEVMDNDSCREMMAKFVEENPDLWNEDGGLEA